MIEQTNQTIRKCIYCGDIKNEFVNGQEFILRCYCDWERAFKDRLLATVHPEFWKNEKKITDWSPAIYKNGGGSIFNNFIRVQKANVILKLYNFYIKEYEENGKIKPSLFKSFDYAKNLFIRGPINSGRGLLVACIKTFVAAKNLSATPILDEWTSFRMLLQESTEYGQIGATAKTKIAEDFRDVKLMTLENLRADRQQSIFENKNIPTKKIRGSTTFDDLLVRRGLNKGSMVFTSLDFIGQINDSFGDILPEVLLSEKTELILLLSVNEVDELLMAMKSRYEQLISVCEDVTGKKTTPQKRIIDRKDENEELEFIKYLFYTDEVFGTIPTTPILELEAYVSNLKRIIKNGGVSDKVKNVYEEFLKEKKENGTLYNKNIKKTKILMIRECKEFGNKVTEKEALEIADMVIMSCKPAIELQEYLRSAIVARSEMAGENNE